MRFAFRVDTSPVIGIGHLMRCLTLANGLRKRGFDCFFICRDFEGNGASRLIGDDFPLKFLSVESPDLSDDLLLRRFEKDFSDTADIIARQPVDWLIIDHYQIDRRWEKEFSAKFPDTRIMVIDDLVREHDCDLLLDQTYGRLADEYRPLVPHNAQLCLGTQYALLREEFATLRSQMDQKPNNKHCHILVTLGGGDQGTPLGIIGKSLRELAKQCLFTATIITGDVSDAHLDDYRSIGDNIKLISFSDDIASEMAKADLAVGAGGGTSWERCCLGLPTVVLTIADNQIEAVEILKRENAIIAVEADVADIMSNTKKLMTDENLRYKMRENAMRVCDGNGVYRLINTILNIS